MQESCLQVRRVVCVTNAPVPQGTSALTTPPFVRAGYDCQNNTTVRRRPEAVGWAPLVCSGTTDYLLRDCGSVGTPAPSNGGTNEGAATQKTDRSSQRGGDPKTDQQKEELSKQLGCERKGPENPGVVAPLTSTSCRGNFWWAWTSTACGVLSRRHLEHFDNEFDLAGLKKLWMLGGRLRQASEVRLVLRICHGVFVLASMFTSGQKDLVEKVAYLHFLSLSSSRCGTHRPHPFQASSGSFRLPRWSPCDHFWLHADCGF